MVGPAHIDHPFEPGELVARLLVVLLVVTRPTDCSRDRLRQAHDRLVDLTASDFPQEVRQDWSDVLSVLGAHGPEYETITDEEADRVLGLVSAVKGRLSDLADLK